MTTETYYFRKSKRQISPRIQQANQYYVLSAAFQNINGRYDLKADRTHAPLVHPTHTADTHTACMQLVAAGRHPATHTGAILPPSRTFLLPKRLLVRGHRTRHKKHFHMRRVTSKEKCSPGFDVCVSHFRLQIHCLQLK